MSRLLVNPGTPSAWDLPLKPGINRLGRGFASDFKIEDASVSGSHCEVIVRENSVVIKDLGSTNGTFVNREQIQEATLETGQSVRLGGVEMVFYSDVAEPAPAPNAAPPVPVKMLSTAPRLAISSNARPVPEAAPESAPPIAPIAPVTSGPRFCKFHPKSPARYLCNKCNRTFCELCVTSRTVSGTVKKTCRSCGVECIPLQVVLTRSAQRGFFGSLPGAFIYPFRGFGSVILVCATIAFAALGFVSAGLFAIFAKILFYGFLFLFMQNIIHTTASDENEPLSFPEGGGLFGAAFQLGGTILISFGLAIGLLVARLFDVEIPVEAIVAAVILGCLYFPMAFLAVAMNDSVLSANPLVVVPAIIKIPLHYLVAAILLMSVFGFRQLGSMISGAAGSVSLTTHNMSTLLIALGIQAAWAFVSVYLLTVNMRILGLLYNANKEKLAWF